MAAGDLISVDPGIGGCSWARFEGGRLLACGMARVKAEGSIPTRAAEAVAALRAATGYEVTLRHVVEWPQVYREGHRGDAGGRGRDADPNDLLGLAAIAGAIAAHVNVETIRPADWKGNLPKPKRGQPYVVATRVASRLEGAERLAWDQGYASVPQSLRHNVADAVGIGLHALGRFERKRVYAR